MKREHWKSRLGFIWAAVGSAVGLGNIWRFPYVVGENGGAVFIFIYLMCLLFVGLPVLVSELVIGRKTQLNPSGAFHILGRTKLWQKLGFLTIITGFLVSTFYGVIAGATLGYLFEAICGKITHFNHAHEALAFYESHSFSTLWMMASYSSFVLLSLFILHVGVRKGIEASNSIMMPLLFFVLLFLVVKGLSLPNSAQGMQFLFNLDLSLLTPTVIIIALGQAFFALSLGQGTMVTYGSYMKSTETIAGTTIPICLFGTTVSLMSGIAIFSIVFSNNLAPDSGPSLMFQTLPFIFSHMSGGYYLAILFFILLFMAAITSQISALEPIIAYLIDRFKWPRHRAVWSSGLAAYLLGIPCALSFGVMKNTLFFGMNAFELVSYLCVNILIPIGGFLAVFLVGWRWGINHAIKNILSEEEQMLKSSHFTKWYFRICIRYIAPILILFVMVDLLGII